MKNVRNLCLLVGAFFITFAGTCEYEADDPTHQVPFEEWCLEQPNSVLRIIQYENGSMLLICEYDGLQ